MLNEETPSTPNGVGTLNSELEGYPLAKLLKGVEKSYDKGKDLFDGSEDKFVFLHRCESNKIFVQMRA